MTLGAPVFCPSVPLVGPQATHRVNREHSEARRGRQGLDLALFGSGQVVRRDGMTVSGCFTCRDRGGHRAPVASTHWATDPVRTGRIGPAASVAPQSGTGVLSALAREDQSDMSGGGQSVLPGLRSGAGSGRDAATRPVVVVSGGIRQPASRPGKGRWSGRSATVSLKRRWRMVRWLIGHRCVPVMVLAQIERGLAVVDHGVVETATPGRVVGTPMP